jgi:hypothetical protein
LDNIFVAIPSAIVVSRCGGIFVVNIAKYWHKEVYPFSFNGRS